MRRRGFITLLGGAAAWPLAAGAQQPSNKPLHVGTAQVGPRGRPQMVAFEQRLRELGYVEEKIFPSNSSMSRASSTAMATP